MQGCGPYLLYIRGEYVYFQLKPGFCPKQEYKILYSLIEQSPKLHAYWWSLGLCIIGTLWSF